MTSLRLTFLYPHLYRCVRASEPIAQTTRQCCRHLASPKAGLATTSRKQQRFVERHGKAVEPFLVLDKTKDDVEAFASKSMPALVEDNAKENKEPRSEGGASNRTNKAIEQKEAPLVTPLPEEPQAIASTPGNMKTGDQMGTTVNKESDSTEVQTEPPAQGAQEDALNLPHLHPPPYVHHFDSYTLVKEVEKGGFTPEQAITAMKAVRLLLTNNLEMAKKGLVSKSDVENQSYLFRAACSELRIEVQNTRKANDQMMRRERTLLQHEVDTLNQKLTQELLTLKDELTGMFNDRKMDVRMEQREMDSAIQQLNYKITVALNSDSKSEVEGLRWVLTRRSALAIVFMALMVLSSLRYASYRAHEDEMEMKRQEKLREADEARRTRDKDGEGMAEGEIQRDREGAPEKRDLPAGTAAETMSAC